MIVEVIESLSGYLGLLIAIVATGAAISISALYFSKTKFPQVCYQSRRLPGKEGVRVSSLMQTNDSFTCFLYDDAQTVYDCLVRGNRISNSGRCMGRINSKLNDYEWLSYETIESSANMFGSTLITLFQTLGFSQNSSLGIYSQNCIEYLITELGCYSQSMVVVPLYDTLEAECRSMIINEAEIGTVVCDTEEKVLALLDEASQTPCLKIIICIRGTPTQLTKDKAKNNNISLHTFQSLKDIGFNRRMPRPHPPSPDTLAVVCYTSGTTGRPKGVALTHKNIIANVSAVLMQLGDNAPSKDDVMLSFLPLAHMFERCCQVAMYMVGGRVGFNDGGIMNLCRNMEILKPTMIPSVPRLLNRIFDKIQDHANESKLLRWTLNVVEADQFPFLTDLLSLLVFKKVRNNLGGRVRLIVVGSAPLDGKVLKLVRAALRCIIVEGYGQTECTAPCTLTFPYNVKVQHSGPPLSCCAVKLVDVPDLNYFSYKNEGEICVKGSSVFSGYLNDSEETKQTLDEDSWLHTGDIGMWNEDGTLSVIDRIKNIFKLSQGEFVAPEKIEAVYSRCPLVSQIFVYGSSYSSCLVGIVVASEEAVVELNSALTLNAHGDDCSKDVILKELRKIGQQAGLKSFEQVKEIYLSYQPFTVENNLLTPTLKTKRRECASYFWPQIKRMYVILGDQQFSS